MGFSIDFYKKLNWVAGLLLIGTLLGIIAFSALPEIRDLDLWLHLKMGEFIVKNGYVPSVDVLSCSFAGKPWINHEWLFQVIVYWVKNTWGMDGLIYMQGVLVMTCFVVLLLLTYEESRELVIAPLFFLVMLVYQTRFTIRPDIFSLLFFALYVYMISLHLDKRWSIGAFFVLQVAWTNIHGYSFLGILIVLIALFSEWMKRHVKMPFNWNHEGVLPDNEYRRLRWILLALFFATLFNPLFLKGAAYPFTVLFGLAGDQGVFFANITELKRPILWTTIFDQTRQMPYKVLILLSAGSFFFNRRKIDISAVLLWAIFLIFSLMAVRNMTYFAFVAYVICLVNVSHLRVTDILPFHFKQPQFLYVTALAASIFFIGMFLDYGRDLSFAGYYDFDKYERKSEFLGISQRQFPNKAVDFLEKNQIKGNFFNDFNSGAYLIGRVYPNIRVYMDGRTELRGGKFFTTYKKIWDDGDESLFDEAAERYYLSGAFVNTSAAPASEKLLKMLFGKKGWRPVYFDYDGVIFLKDTPQNNDVISRFKIDFAHWLPKELDTHRLADARVFPYHHMSRAHTLRALGFNDQALLEVDAALKVTPANFDAFKLKAEIYRERGDFQKSFENWRLASIFNGEDDPVLKDFAQAYFDVGDYAGAIKLAQRAVEGSPSDPAGYIVLAKAFAKSKQYEKGYDILWRALSKKSPNLKDVILFGDICLADGMTDLAFKSYEEVLKRDIRFIEGYQKLAQVYEVKEDQKAALVTLKRALRMDPKNEDLKKRIKLIEDRIKGGKG
ncbi:MAG: tetratricopeptide repeat protein [Candidatus Omnitrophica bacterium]|nr:tetratricopeptide repeat protein [Candidatus Omnitrophota bacterium]